MRLSPVGYQPSISWSRYYYYYYYYYYYKKDAFRSKILKKTWLSAIKTLDGSQQSKQSESQTQIESETQLELESESYLTVSDYHIKKANEYRFYEKYGIGIKILSSKLLLQRFPIALAPVRAAIFVKIFWNFTMF